MCIATVLAAVMSVIPFLPNWLVSVPFAVAIALEGNTTWACVLLLLHIAIYLFVDAEMYDEIDSSHPFMVGLSVVAGIFVFDVQVDFFLNKPLSLVCFFLLFSFPLFFSLHL